MEKNIKRYFPIFVLPTLIAFLIAFVIPFIMGLYLSFCDFTTVTNSKFVGLSNYMNTFSDKEFLNALWFTVKFALIAVVTINFFGFIMALLLTKGLKGDRKSVV